MIPVKEFAIDFTMQNPLRGWQIDIRRVYTGVRIEGEILEVSAAEMKPGLCLRVIVDYR